MLRSERGAYGYAGTYKLKPDAPDADDAVRTLSSFYVPVFEKLLADGTIVEYEIDREMIHTTDSALRCLPHASALIEDASLHQRWHAKKVCSRPVTYDRHRRVQG